MKITKVKISQVKENPDNPRFIRNDRFEKLKKSILDFPQMLEIRPIVVNDDMVVLGGNMRLKACKEVGLEEIPIIKASDLSISQQKEFAIKDNLNAGQWSWDDLANEWDVELLEDWGMDNMEDFSAFEPDEGEEEEEGEEREKPAPRGSGDDHSVFELVMLHANKLKLIETIARAKSQHGFEKSEDALMQIIRTYNKSK